VNFRQIEYRIACHELKDKRGWLRELSRYCGQTDCLGYADSVFGHVLIALLLLGSHLMMRETGQAISCVVPDAEIVAQYVAHAIKIDAARSATEWQHARPISFCSDWHGKNPDPERVTEVRVLWSPDSLYIRYECRYRALHVFNDADANGRRDHLWDRDVAEAFLQPDSSGERYYKEFEVSPNGMWIDLNVFPGGISDLKSGLQQSVVLNDKSRTWVAELAIPMKALTANFDPKAVWRANFYRIEGAKEPRSYMAWQPTGTPAPNFHVPSAFGRLRFAGSP
jgi:cellulose/xylan binding protein with CBM9 domain